MTSAPPLTPGSLWNQGRYQIRGLLHQGRWSLTLQAVQSVNQQPILLKLPQRGDALLAGQAQRLQQIWQRLGHFQHPQAQQTLDFFEEGEWPVLAIEAIPGASLAHQLQKQPWSEIQAIALIQKVGLLLQIWHQRQILHLDLKPENLIIHAQSKAVVLVDWGLLPDLEVAAETSPYTAPEYTASEVRHLYQTTGSFRNYDSVFDRCDIYSLAATLYTLVTGKTPTPATLRSQSLLASPRQLQPQLSPLTEQAILQGMELDPHLRPRSLGAWLAMLPSAAHLLAKPAPDLPEAEVTSSSTSVSNVKENSSSSPSFSRPSGRSTVPTGKSRSSTAKLPTLKSPVIKLPTSRPSSSTASGIPVSPLQSPESQSPGLQSPGLQSPGINGRSGGGVAPLRSTATISKQTAAKQTAAKQTPAKQTPVKQTSAKQTAAKQTSSQQTLLKQTASNPAASPPASSQSPQSQSSKSQNPDSRSGLSRWGRSLPKPLRLMVILGITAGGLGLGCGLALRFNHSQPIAAPGFLQQDQLFPEQAWPGSVSPEIPDSAPFPEATWSDPQPLPNSENDYPTATDFPQDPEILEPQTSPDANSNLGSETPAADQPALNSYPENVPASSETLPQEEPGISPEPEGTEPESSEPSLPENQFLETLETELTQPSAE